MTPIEWTSDPCPEPEVPVTPAVVPPIIEVTVSEPNVVEPKVVSEVGSDSANPEEVQEP